MCLQSGTFQCDGRVIGNESGATIHSVDYCRSVVDRGCLRVAKVIGFVVDSPINRYCEAMYWLGAARFTDSDGDLRYIPLEDVGIYLGDVEWSDLGLEHFIFDAMQVGLEAAVRHEYEHADSLIENVRMYAVDVALTTVTAEQRSAFPGENGDKVYDAVKAKTGTLRLIAEQNELGYWEAFLCEEAIITTD